MTELLQIGLDRWVIDAGNRRDFTVGEIRSFALEFSSTRGLHRIDEVGFIPTMSCLGEAFYSVKGCTVHVKDSNCEVPWCIIDIGLLAFSTFGPMSPPPPYFNGQIELFVDPVLYHSMLHTPDAPAIEYEWKIHRIEVETAPRILRGDLMIFDPSQRKRVEVQSTETGEDFMLHCERLSGPHKLSFVE